MIELNGLTKRFGRVTGAGSWQRSVEGRSRGDSTSASGDRRGRPC
jgi:hypothetical protein